MSDWGKDISEPISEDAIYRLLTLTEELVMTAAEIAEHFGVTNQTVYNHINGVEDRTDIYTKDVGNAKAYYHRPLPVHGSEEWDEMMGWAADQTLEDARREFSQAAWRSLVHVRAEFLDDCDTVRHAYLSGEDTLRDRYLVLGSIEDYVLETSVLSTFDIGPYVSQEIEELDSPKREPSPRPPRGSEVSKERMMYFLSGIPMFTSEWYGEVNGIGDLGVFGLLTRRRIREFREEYDSGELAEEDLSAELERIYPPLPTLLSAAQTLDDVVAETFYMGWCR